MVTPDRESLANGLVRIGEEAVARSNDALIDDYKLHSPAGDFNRDAIGGPLRRAVRELYRLHDKPGANRAMRGTFISFVMSSDADLNGRPPGRRRCAASRR